MEKLKIEDAVPLYRLLCKARALAEGVIINRGKIPGVVVTGLGQEAASVVPLLVLKKLGILGKSVFHFDHRMIWGAVGILDETIENPEKKLTLDFLRNYFARATGGNRGRDGNVHIGWPKHNVVPLGSSDMGVWPAVTVGFVEEKARFEHWYNIMNEKSPVGLVYFGDGASNQGLIHEMMNWAWRFHLPIIFGVNNNRIALFTSSHEGHGDTELYKRASGYGDTKGFRVNGNDPSAVWSTMHEAVGIAQMRTPVLVEFMTSRLTGHNEDHVARQISRPEELREKRDFFSVKHVDGLSEKGLEEFEKAASEEPLRMTQRFLVSQGLLPKIACSEHPLRDPIIDEERALIDELIEQVQNEQKITIELDSRDRSVFPPLPAPRVYSIDPRAPKKEGVVKPMKYNDAFAWIVGELMHEDHRVMYMGEDVSSTKGGVLALTKGLLERFGKERIINTPISEEMFTAIAVGRTLADGKPIIEFQFAPFFREASRIFRHCIAPQWFQRKYRLGLISVFPSGIVHEGSSGEYHEGWPERDLLPMQGIAIVAPADAYEVVGLLRAAYESDWPVAFLLQTSAASSAEFARDIPLSPYTIPLGKAHIVREGKDFTVVTYGAACVAAVKNEAEFLAKEGIRVEVINLRTIHPWDVETVKLSFQKTGRIAFMHEDYADDGSVGQQLVGKLLQEKGILSTAFMKEIPVLGASTPFIPSDSDLVWERLPYERIVSDDGKNKFHRSKKLAALIKAGMAYR